MRINSVDALLVMEIMALESEVQGSLTPSQQRFVSLLESAWFPPHPEVLARVRERVRDDEAIKDRPALERELQRDPSIYLRTIRELTVLAVRDAVEAGRPPNTSPPHLLRAASVQALREVLDVPAERCTAVPYHGAPECAGKHTAQALFSSLTAEALARGSLGEEGLGFASGLFRQLGMLLIVWHHPHVYSRISGSLKIGESLDEGLARVLGVSPVAIGLTIAREWQVSPVIRAAMGDNVDEEPEPVRVVGRRLKGLCELGESVARGQFMRASSAGLKEYQEASARVQLILGNDGMRAIFGEVERACEYLTRTFPSVFAQEGSVVSARPRRAVTELSADLPPFVREQLAFIQENFPAGSSPERLRSVVEQFVRSLGFQGGALYLFDPGEGRLLPRVGWGAVELESVRSVEVASDLDDVPSDPKSMNREDVIARAFLSRGLVINSRAVTTLAISVGVEAGIGVLALEMKREFLEPRLDLIKLCVGSLGRVVSEAIDL